MNVFSETFLQAIVDLNLRLIQTVSEADHEIAKFAAKSKSEAKACFVVSNDTDFCIYDVDVISLDSTLCAESILQNGYFSLTFFQIDKIIMKKCFIISRLFKKSAMQKI